MENQIIQIFNELKEEARLGEVNIIDNENTVIFRILFNVVESNIFDNMSNLYIKDKENFNKILTIYVYKALKFYNLDYNENNIKKVLSFLFINITNTEMNDLESFVLKYIDFLDDKILENKQGEKDTNLGKLQYQVDTQSYKQETPYCFKSKFINGENEYALPRISFGISNGVCYIYAIQNKDRKESLDSDFNTEVKNKLRSINSGISKYRNVTPSFVVALSLFVSFLKENNIDKVKVVTPLPIRQKNRDMSLDYKIKFYSMKGNLDRKQVEILKKELEDKKLNDDYNSTVKFINCFNRLKIHFDGLFLRELDSEITIDIINLITQNEFLTEIVKEKER